MIPIPPVLYLDTSVVVTALVNEPATSRVLTWMASEPPGRFAISDWVITELSSALSIKLRIGRLDMFQRAAALTKFNGLRAASFMNLSFSSPEFHAAGRFADQHTLSLRGGDALHLAICAAHGATLCTLDVRQCEAGPAIGVVTRLV